MNDEKTFMEETVDLDDTRIRQDNPDLMIEDITYAITKNRMILNQSVSPDELVSVASFMLHDIVKIVAEYSEKMDEEPIPPSRIMEKIVDVARAYALIETGMKPEEALEVIGINPKSAVPHYTNVNTGERITQEEFDELKKSNRKK